MADERKKYVIIPAGGVGARMGAQIPKQMLPLAGIPILRRTVELFLDLPFEVGIIISINPTLKEAWKQYCKDSGFILKHTLVNGGMTRFHSIKNALKFVSDGAVVAVHDAVRPLLRSEEIIAFYEAAEKHPAVIPAIDVVDSMRHFNAVPNGADAAVSKIVPRGEYRLIQTPQIFHSEVLKEAYRQPYLPDFTDDASVVERLGIPLYFAQGSRLNIKLTTPEDMLMAEAILKDIL